MKKFLPFLALLLVAACADTRPVKDAPPVSFERLRTVPVNAAAIEVVDNYKSSGAPPHIEQLFRETPAAAAARLARRQLLPAGATGTLRVSIDDASVTVEKQVLKRSLLDRAVFLLNFGHVDPPMTIKGRVRLRLELVDPYAPDIVIAHAGVLAERERELMEQASPRERDRAYTDLTEGLMNDLNEGFHTVTRSTFAVKQN